MKEVKKEHPKKSATTISFELLNSEGKLEVVNPRTSVFVPANLFCEILRVTIEAVNKHNNQFNQEEL